MHGFTYTFPAMKGVQAGNEYYVAMCPLKLLPKLFIFNENELPPEIRAQRSLNTARIPEIAKYILENPDCYAFSAITASIDGLVNFIPASIGEEMSNVGQLIVPMSARFVINDGQHRRAAIETALSEKPDLGDETIAVVFYLDAGLERCQQLFADLNKHAVRPTKSLGVLYDYRDPLSRLSLALIESVPCFKGFTEVEKTTISNRSVKLFTLSGIYQATGDLLGKSQNDPISESEVELAKEFWNELFVIIPEWKMVVDRQVSSSEIRKEYVHVHNVILHSLGQAGHDAIEQYPKKWKEKLSKLKDVDWSRHNPIWEGRAMTAGQMSKVHQNVRLTSNYLRMIMGLTLSDEEKSLESRMSKK